MSAGSVSEYLALPWNATARPSLDAIQGELRLGKREGRRVLVFLLPPTAFAQGYGGPPSLQRRRLRPLVQSFVSAWKGCATDES